MTYRTANIPPTYVFIRDVQAALGWLGDGHNGYKRTLRWLRRKKLLVRRAGRLVTTRELLMVEMPEVWDRIAQDAVELEEVRRRR